MKELKVGLRISREQGLSFFGLDEVNKAIASGAKVVEIREGNALMHKAKEDDRSTRLNFSGFSMIVILEE